MPKARKKPMWTVTFEMGLSVRADSYDEAIDIAEQEFEQNFGHDITAGEFYITSVDEEDTWYANYND